MFSRFVASQVKHNSFFLVGLIIGLWVALVAVPFDDDAVTCDSVISAVNTNDEYEPVRETRTGGNNGPVRGVTRPRYYSTELGMRNRLLAAVLSSEEALHGRAAALNLTVSRLQPAFRIFMTARALHSAPPMANVVGFTDTREMLRPFHALKYLADNFLEEYDFFFLATDETFINARALTELVSKLSVSQDVYMGTLAEEDSHYCTLEGGILLSSSVLRGVHAELDWCVRNSYSASHHENLGRCVLHAAGPPCQSATQGVTYTSLALDAGPPPPTLAAAVAAHPATAPEHFFTLHAYVSRLHLQRDAARARDLQRELLGAGAAWPAGLRAEPAPVPSRFDHERWTLFNATHALMPSELRAAAPLPAPHRRALHLVVSSVSAWCEAAWGGRVQLVEGWWRYQPAVGTEHRLLLAHTDADTERRRLRLVAAVRPLGAARLVPARYVTESARVHVVLALPAGARGGEPAAGDVDELALCARNTNTTIVVVQFPGTEAAALRDSERWARALAAAAPCRVAALTAAAGSAAPNSAARSRDQLAVAARAAAWERVRTSVPRDALVLLRPADVRYNDDFLNRVRMNCVSGEQWFSPLAFSRYAIYPHAQFVDARGRKPSAGTGRFNARRSDVIAFYRRDYDEAWTSWITAGYSAHADPRDVLLAAGGAGAGAGVTAGGGALRVLSAPEPALIADPPPHACQQWAGSGNWSSCLHNLDIQQQDLGAPRSLAELLLRSY